jgi:hypothetical protein
VTPVAPASVAAAQSQLALPEENKARCVALVVIPPKTRVRIGHAAPLFRHKGGGAQIQIVSRLSRVSFSHDRALSPYHGNCP